MSAIFSPCGAFRYRLDRHYQTGMRTAVVVMVNPSTADANSDDHTIRKLNGFARRNDINHLIVVNKFAFVSTHVEILSTIDDPIGPENDNYIRSALTEADILIFAWGAISKVSPRLRGRWRDILQSANDANHRPQSIGVNACGHPRHPLTTSYSTPLKPWIAP